MITVEQLNKQPTIQLYGDSSTKFSDDCPNSVVAADIQQKSEIQVNRDKTINYNQVNSIYLKSRLEKPFEF